MRTCTVDNCPNVHLCRGLCAMHHARWKRHGDPTITVNIPTSEKIAWLEEVALTDTDDCIIWPFKVGNHGYGFLWVNQKFILAHHYVLMLQGHQKPKRGEKETRHLCNNKLCVNSHHLRVGTHKENASDRDKAGVVPRGEKNGNSKLTNEQIIEIRNDSRSCRVLANEYKISNQLISMIKNRKRWAHID